MAYRITVIKDDNCIYLENTYATIAEANKASFSRRILEALDVLEYDYVTITEVSDHPTVETNPPKGG